MWNVKYFIRTWMRTQRQRMELILIWRVHRLNRRAFLRSVTVNSVKIVNHLRVVNLCSDVLYVDALKGHLDARMCVQSLAVGVARFYGVIIQF
mmetsp:Transcript_13574/g.33892  ORF Transcript_13574/g.33892 Transcript_13574/m.33892 type:complete len:93 (-) Transcript_13574:11-289(-)